MRRLWQQSAARYQGPQIVAPRAAKGETSLREKAQRHRGAQRLKSVFVTQKQSGRARDLAEALIGAASNQICPAALRLSGGQSRSG